MTPTEGKKLCAENNCELWYDRSTHVWWITPRDENGYQNGMSDPLSPGSLRDLTADELKGIYIDNLIRD